MATRSRSRNRSSTPTADKPRKGGKFRVLAKMIGKKYPWTEPLLDWLSPKWLVALIIAFAVIWCSKDIYALGRTVHSWMRQPQLNPLHSPHFPELTGITLELTNVPYETSPEDISIFMEIQKLFPPSDYELHEDEGGRVLINLDPTVFRWASGPNEFATVKVRIQGRQPLEAMVPLAVFPRITIPRDRNVSLLSDGADLYSPNVDSVIRLFIEENWGCESDLYVIGSEPISIDLPESILRDSIGFHLRLDGDEYNIEERDKIISQLQSAQMPTAAFAHLHSLELTYRGRVLDGVLISRALVPLGELENGRPWQLPWDKLDEWQYEPGVSPLEIKAGSNVSKARPGEQGLNELVFAHLKFRLASGLYAVFLEAKGIRSGSVHIPYTHSFESVIPAGVGQNHPEYKPDNCFDWKPDEFSKAAEEVKSYGAKLDIDKHNKTVVKLPDWEREFSIADYTVHKLVQLVEINPKYSKVVFTLFVDNQEPFSLPKGFEPADCLTVSPTIRHRGCRALHIQSFHIMFLPRHPAGKRQTDTVSR